jgi:hypothetical protein
VRELPPTSLDALPGNGTGASSPEGEDTQGPSPVDYRLEVQAAFPPAMVIELQKCTALRARKTVIGRTLAGRASFKDLQDCLKLHLPAPFLTVTVATLTWPSVGVKPNTWKSWGFGVLRDSRAFRARQQDPKHLALECSWCHWKGLEA